jgi:Fe-S cluster assembly scaffold protein SufB
MAASAPRFQDWLSSEEVDGLSRDLNDPPAYAAFRSDAFREFLALPLEPNPLFRKYGYFAGVDLRGVAPTAAGPRVPLPRPPGDALQVVHDASGTQAIVPESLRDLGVEIRTLPEIWRSDDETIRDYLGTSEKPLDRLSALGSALLNRGYGLSIPDGCRTPIRVQDLTILSQPHEALSVRRKVRAGVGAQLLLTEEIFSMPGGIDHQRLYASSTDLTMHADAKAVCLTTHVPDLKTVAVYRRNADVGAAGRLAWIFNGFGGFRSKIRNRTTFAGPGSQVDDLQSFYGASDQAYDSSVNLVHVATDTHGQSITRGVFTDDARGMSRGLVRIEHSARKTISYISEHAMLLSKGARSDTLPILEILCRDVKATHSTSVAPVDPEKIFYLESRGIDESDAIRAIGEGFLAHVLDRAPIEALRDLLYPILESRWDRRDIRWNSGDFPSLPELTVTGTPSSPDWRFDAKLR